jgi:ornithine cyclodeaminase/alanine dehydrogenase-like protein (mu-crystallin family)
MPLLLDQDHIAQLADMGQCMQFVEQSLGNLSQERSFAQPHVRIQTPVRKDTTYWSNIMSGGNKSLDTFAIRINSALNQDVEIGGMKRSQFLGERSHGLILTYSLSTGELLCIFPDFDISGLRVGATQGVGSKYLAKRNASKVAGFGKARANKPRGGQSGAAAGKRGSIQSKPRAPRRIRTGHGSFAQPPGATDRNGRARGGRQRYHYHGYEL